MKAFDLAASVPWAIRPESLELILQIAARAHEPNFEAAAARLLEREHELAPEAVSATAGQRIEGARYARLRGGTAVLPVEGPIFRYANLMTALSGATSVEALAKDLQLALDSPDVASILLHVDSPGGQVNGVAEFADMVYAARDRKPIVAYISHEGCSAGYWIASAAQRVIVSQTAMVGCIGAVLAVPDPKQDASGRVEFVSANAPNKRPDPGSRGGREQIESIVDALGDQFVQAVARNRGVSVETVMADFGQGGILVGQKAVDAGLADASGSFEQVLAELGQSSGNDEPPAAEPAIVARPATNTNRRSRAMGFKERWEAFMDSADGGDDQPAPTAARPAASAPAESAELVALRERTERLEAENTRITQERIHDQAAVFADVQIREYRAVPAERDTIVAQYVQAATDDRLHGLVNAGKPEATSRVSLLAATFAARPPHQLTVEQLKPDELAVLQNRQKTESATSDRPADEKRVNDLVGMTPLGRATLADRNGKN